MTLNSVGHYGDYGYEYNKPAAIESTSFTRKSYCCRHELIILFEQEGSYTTV